MAMTMRASASHQGMNPSRIRPTTTPAIPHFMCGDMLTPSLRTGSPQAARLPSAYSPPRRPVDRSLRGTLPAEAIPGRPGGVTISMPVEPEANDLLARSPLALLIAMVLDQQVPLERAFSAPLDLARRLGHEPTAAELLARVAQLPGFGARKARIFVALLGKQLGVRPDGWREAAGAFGAEGTHLSVADISDAASLAEVRSHKRSLKAAPTAARGAP